MTFMSLQHLRQIIRMFLQCKRSGVIKVREYIEPILLPNPVLQSQQLMWASVESINRDDGRLGQVEVAFAKQIIRTRRQSHRHAIIKQSHPPPDDDILSLPFFQLLIIIIPYTCEYTQ